MRLALIGGRRGPRLLGSTLGFMTHQACEAAVPILIGVVIDQAIVPHDGRALALWLGVLGAVFLVLSVSYQRAALAMVRTYGHAEHDLRQLALRRVLDPRGMRAARGTGEVLSIATSDTYRVAGVTYSVASQGSVLAAILATAVALLVISVPLGLAVLVGSALMMVGTHALARPIERLGMAEQSSAAGASEVATDAMAGLRIVHGLRAQPQLSRRYRAASDQSRRGAIRAARTLVTYESVSGALSTTFLALLALAAGWMTARGTITPGELVTVVGLAQFVQGALGLIGQFGPNWLHKRASARRLQALLTEEHALPGIGHGGGPAGVLGTTSQAPAAAEGADRCGGAPVQPDPILVWTVAPGRQVRVHRGRLVGLAITGAAQGRSLASRAAHRVPLAPGEIRVAGDDAAGLEPRRYRRRVIAPPHHGAVFSGTLAMNVGLGRLEPEPSVVRVAALDDVIDLIGGAEASVGEAGRRLSGGQRQRLLLARALHDPGEVLVLDEPTTALDPITEQAVAQRLRSSGLTALVLTSSPLLLAACHERIDLTDLTEPDRRAEDDGTGEGSR